MKKTEKKHAFDQEKSKIIGGKEERKHENDKEKKVILKILFFLSFVNSYMNQGILKSLHRQLLKLA